MHRIEKDLINELCNFKHIIWDWNGTLLDDTDQVLEINNILLKEYGLKEITLDDYRHHFCHPVKDYYTKLGFDLEKVSFSEVGAKFVKHYNAMVANIGLFEGVSSVLESLKQAGCRQWILSAANEKDLHEFVPNLGISHYFEAIYGLGHYDADSKVARGFELLEKIDANKSDVIMVGDTDHDFEVANKLGIKVLLVANGHQSPQRLRQLTDRILISH